MLHKSTLVVWLYCDDNMREAVKSEEQAAEALDDETEERDKDNAIKIEELQGPTLTMQ